MAAEEVRDCVRCGGPRIHRGDKCQACALVLKMRGLDGKKPFDLVHMIAVGAVVITMAAIWARWMGYL